VNGLNIGSREGIDIQVIL